MRTSAGASGAYLLAFDVSGFCTFFFSGECIIFSELKYMNLFRSIQSYSILIGSLLYNKWLIVRFVIFLIYVSLFHIVGLGIN